MAGLAAAGLAQVPAAVAAAERNESKVEPTPLDSPGSWLTEQDYPVDAQLDGVEGITAFSLTVAVDGRVSDCQVTTSSGSEALDETTCRILRQRARFSPALDRRSRPMEAKWSSRIIWRIPQQEPQKISDYPRRLRFVVDVDEEGVPESCRILEKIGDATWSEQLKRSVDPCEIILRVKKPMPILDGDGVPIRARVELTTETRVTPR